MQVKTITFIYPLTDTEDIYDDNIDVIIELDNGLKYTVFIGTPKNVLSLINKDQMDFWEPGCPFLIVRKLTMEVIGKAIDAHLQDDAYWLKFYHFSGDITSEMFDELQEDQDKFDSFDMDSFNNFDQEIFNFNFEKKEDKMLVKKISFRVPLTEIENVYDDNIDVCIELEDGSEYEVVIGTPKNLLTLMNKHQMDFSEPGYPFIIVRKLTMEVIEKAIHGFLENNAYWLKLHHFSADIKSEMFDELQEHRDILWSDMD